MKLVRLLSSSITLVAMLSSCKVARPIADAELKSGFAGNDCATAKADLAFQAPKLASAKSALEAGLTAYATAQSDAPKFEDVASEAACNDKLLKDSGTASATSVHADVYQKCIDFHTVLTLVKAREERLDTTECKQGADLSTVVPLFISSCDLPCQFTNVECGLVELDANGKKRRFACGSTASALDAANGYCREFSVAADQCKVGAPVLKKGNEIAQPKTVLAGGETDAVQLSLSGFAAGVASAEYTGGVVVSAEGRVEFKAQGTITLELTNESRAARAGEFIAAGTEATCKMSLTGFSTASASAFVGVGGSFKVFGNGVEAKAGAEGGFALELSASKSSALGKVQGGGLEAQVVLERCIPLARKWLETNVASEFKPFADELAKHVDKFKEASQQAADAAFNALSRGEEGVDVKGRIFCSTDASASINSGNKVYRILKFYASVGSGTINVKADYDGSLNPFSYTTGTYGWGMKGNARGEALIKKISADGVSVLSDDDMRWLLTDLVYSGSNKFTDCSRSGF